jgi:hypothetical protein
MGISNSGEAARCLQRVVLRRRVAALTLLSAANGEGINLTKTVHRVNTRFAHIKKLNGRVRKPVPDAVLKLFIAS